MKTVTYNFPDDVRDEFMSRLEEENIEFFKSFDGSVTVEIKSNEQLDKTQNIVEDLKIDIASASRLKGGE